MTDSNGKRESLIDQARHLIDEIDALARQVKTLPGEILSVSPLESEPSIKELYALIALYDRHVYLPALEAMVAGRQPVLEEREDGELLEDAPWNERSFPEILGFVRQSRKDLLQFLESLRPDDWKRSAVVGERMLTVFDIVYAAIQHDAEVLRVVALRIHDIGTSP